VSRRERTQRWDVHEGCFTNCHLFFREGFELNILQQENDELVFELIGCDTSFANALRRILLAEVPTVALEYVYMWNNTSLIHDEVLSHRLGLVPLNIDARLFDTMEEGEDATDRNTVVFQMKVSCGRAPAKSGRNASDDTPMDADFGVFDNPDLDRAALAAARKEAIETPGRPYTKHVYSSDLIWMPQGDQAERFPDGIKPIHDKILLAKLRPGQEIELEAHGRVGIGRDHAKFSPVATASYRLATEVTLMEPVFDEDAEELVHIYEPGVFELVPSSVPGRRVEARVCNTYACTMSRNYMRNPTLAKAVKMIRIPNHFIFSVESVGMQQPAVLVAEALRVLQGKCTSLLELIQEQELA
jgi:DNA-directed RNA polymerases I and III subunit RPAC1